MVGSEKWVANQEKQLLIAFLKELQLKVELGGIAEPVHEGNDPYFDPIVNPIVFDEVNQLIDD